MSWLSQGVRGLAGALGGGGNVANLAMGLFQALNPPKLKQTPEKMTPEQQRLFAYVMALAGVPGGAMPGMPAGAQGIQPMPGVQALPTMNLLGPQIMNALQGYSNLNWRAPQTMDIPGTSGQGGMTGYQGSQMPAFDFSKLNFPWATPGINPTAPAMNPFMRRRLPLDRNLLERY